MNIKKTTAKKDMKIGNIQEKCLINTLVEGLGSIKYLDFFIIRLLGSTKKSITLRSMRRYFAMHNDVMILQS